MEYAGDLYRLPAPVSQFIQNGWVLCSSRWGAPQPPGNTRALLRKGKQLLRTNIHNDTDGEIAAQNG